MNPAVGASGEIVVKKLKILQGSPPNKSIDVDFSVDL